MAYTKKLEIRIDGSMIQWNLDVSEPVIKISCDQGFDLTTDEMRKVTDIIENIARICSICPDVKSIEYSDI